MASTYLQRTESAGNRRTFTWSAWVKRTKTGASQFLAACSYSSSDESYFFFNGSDKLIWQSSSGSQGDVQTNRVFRDTNAWYHIVLAVDTTQATASNRIRFYVNGVEETSFSNASYPNQDTQLYWNVGGTYYPRIGRRHAASDYFDGVMSHVAHIDGTQESPAIFGETDSTTGEWNIKTSITPSSGWGTNGYWILKDGNSVTDQSGQGNNWTVQGGSVTKSEDNPSNVFATWSPLMAKANINLIHGNTSIRPQANSIDFQTASTLAFKTGKFYAEFKYLENDGHQMYGISTTEGAMELKRNTQFPGQTTTSVAMYASNGSIYENNSATSYGSGWGNNSIIMMAVDADNNKIYFGNNGTWYNSGNPSTGANGYSFNATNLAGFKYMVAGNGTVGYDNTDANFGNGYIGTTAVSSAGSNASGNGIFEYDVPTGYTALCTKGLNT